MAYTINSSGMVGAQAIADASATQNHRLGTRVRAADPTNGEGEFVYLKGVASTVVTSWVSYDALTGLTTLLVGNTVGPVAIAMSANAATTSYGWYQIYGAANGRSATSIAINTTVFAVTGTPGGVDDTVVDGDMIHGAKCISTIAGSVTTGTFMLHYPYCDDITTND